MAEVRQKKPEQILQLKPNNELVFKGVYSNFFEGMNLTLFSVMI